MKLLELLSATFIFALDIYKASIRKKSHIVIISRLWV